METPTWRKHSPTVGITVKGTGMAPPGAVPSEGCRRGPHETGTPGVGQGNASLRGKATEPLHTATVRVWVWGSFQSLGGSA